MTSSEQAIICKIIKAAMEIETPVQSMEWDFEANGAFARMQQIEALLIVGSKLYGNPFSDDMKKRYIGHLVASERQLGAFRQICAAFEQHSIDYLPLKGCIIKEMYPSPVLRSMGDIDILIKTEQYDRIKPLMAELGFTANMETDHELVWIKPGIVVELHKHLIPSNNKDYYAYYGDGWQLAKPAANSCRYEMSPEDTLIFLVTHFAKHYRDKGIGIRQAIDLYVYQKAYPDLDQTYVKNQLAVLHLDRFFTNVNDMLCAWFGNAPHTESSQTISDRVFSGTVFGNDHDLVLSSMLQKQNATGSLLNAKLLSWKRGFFLPRSRMHKMYPILNKMPVLLPVFWIIRGFEMILFDRKKLSSFHQRMNIATTESVDQYQEMLRRSGLDFHF